MDLHKSNILLKGYEVKFCRKIFLRARSIQKDIDALVQKWQPELQTFFEMVSI